MKLKEKLAEEYCEPIRDTESDPEYYTNIKSYLAGFEKAKELLASKCDSHQECNHSLDISCWVEIKTFDLLKLGEEEE